MQKFDVIIIGAGPGGVAAARLLGRAGKNVALVENREWGGTCLNRGCVPTKLLLGAVAPLGLMENLSRGRIIEGTEKVNFDLLRERVHMFVSGTRKALALELINLGVHLIRGQAQCLGPTTIAVESGDGGARKLESENIIFACGSRTSTYPNLVPDGHVILGSTTILEQEVIPASLIICGGGTIGIELTDFFLHMGTKVTIAEAAPQICPTEDSDIGMQMRLYLERRGVVCMTGVRAVSLAADENGQARLTLANGDVHTAEKGLIASGRMPNTSTLDADAAGIALNRRGFITTDYFLRSSPNSWAIGDVNGKILLAHAAAHQGEYVARTILGQEKGPYVPGPCPSCFHGSQEIMRVGMTEREAVALGGEVYISKVHFASNVMAQAAGNPYGFVKVVWRNDDIVGIAAIGANVSQLTLSAQLLLIGQYQGEKLDTFMVAHPTLDEALVAAIRARRVASKD
ncbi:MAG: NAD(P)/FAD-dependent oxidoreductase [Desulfovibrionaceae bacterium]|nr:NAD(P)/FAD-dependent oxidoreductase [Desulfovibrionaceae bacterium]